MAVIGKIREKSTLLLIIIGGALAAFVLGDMFSSQMLFGGNGPKFLGEISGEEISPAQFEAEVQKQITLYKERERTEEIPDGLESQIREQVWNTMLQDNILGKEYSELGVVVGSKELADLVYGSNPHPQVVQAFTDPNTGQFDPSNVIRFIKNLDQDESGTTKKQWLSFENAIKQQRLANKYNLLISKGLYATDNEAKQQFQETNTRYTVKYVAKKYGMVPDSTIKVSEGEIKDYYNDNQKEFEQERLRTVEYVNFDIIPSAEDSAETREWVNETYQKFKATTNDSLFVSINSDTDFDRNLYSKGTLPAGMDTSILDKDSVGYINGPKLLPNGTFRMVKISKIKYAPDSVKARHILITYNKNDKDSALIKADSIKTALENGADFATLARELSEDPSNKADSGNLGWFKEGMMLKAINDSSFKAKVGEYFIVNSRIGAHVFEVLERSPVVKKMKLAIIDRKIEPSRETYDNYFVKANQFSLEVEEGKDFDNLASENQVTAMSAALKENDNDLNGMAGSRQIVRWAYKATEGQVSEPFTLTDNFVIVRLVDSKEDGVAPFEKVKETAKLGAIREKKAAMFADEMRGEDINAIAEKVGVPVNTSSDITFASFSIPQIGFEPDLLGKIFSLNQGDLSFPIKGKNGVYVVWVESITPAEEKEDYSQSKTQIAQSRQSRVNYEVFEALKERAEITDNRYLFY